MQMKRWLHLYGDLWGIRSLRLVQKNRQKKFPFIATNNWIVWAVWWSAKYSFCSEFPDITEKWWRRRWRKPANAKRFAFQANAITKLVFIRKRNSVQILKNSRLPKIPVVEKQTKISRERNAKTISTINFTTLRTSILHKPLIKVLNEISWLSFV